MFEETNTYQAKDILMYGYSEFGISLTVRQLAYLEPVTGGNKWYKLKYNLQKAKTEGKISLLTFGGAYSNHIAATARAGKKYGFETTGVIRGEVASVINPTLSRAKKDGMSLIFVSREDYKRKNETGFISGLLKDYSKYYIIPEGGANSEGVFGCKEILTANDNVFDHIVVCSGTGTTAAGIILSLQQHQKLTGISVLRDNGFLEQKIKNWICQFDSSVINPKWEINHDYHFGGYAKKTDELVEFCRVFNENYSVKIEPVYTGKMFFALDQLIRRNYFKHSSRILAIHTGGLQYMS